MGSRNTCRVRDKASQVPYQTSWMYCCGRILCLDSMRWSIESAGSIPVFPRHYHWLPQTGTHMSRGKHEAG
jgi:hypothetical protein